MPGHANRRAESSRSLQDTPSCDKGQYQPQQHKPWKEWDSNFSVHQLREMQAQERKLRDIANGMVGQQRIDMVMDACYRKCMYEVPAGLQVEALQKNARQCALSHLGLSSTAVIGIHKQVFHLPTDWGIACMKVLTPAHQKEISEHFGSQFKSFLESRSTVTDSAPETRPLLSPNMLWAERAFLMDAIEDELEPEAVREGGRIAYLAFMGCKSWEAERKKVDSYSNLAVS